MFEPADEPGRREFIDDVLRYWDEKEVPLKNAPLMGRKTLDLFRLYQVVKEKGGMVEVSNIDLLGDTSFLRFYSCCSLNVCYLLKSVVM